MNKRVFLSYSHSDADPVWLRAFVEQLRTNNVDVWWDEQIRPGDSIADAMERAFRDSDAVLIIVSDGYLKSPWTAFEMGAGLAQNKRLIPIAPDGLSSARWPEPLRVRRSIRQRGPEETAQELARALMSPTNN